MIANVSPKVVFGMHFKIKIQKINDSMLDIYGILVAVFFLTDKANWIRFFEETFLVANVSLEVVFRMSNLILSSTDINSLNKSSDKSFIPFKKPSQLSNALN